MLERRIWETVPIAELSNLAAQAEDKVQETRNAYQEACRDRDNLVSILMARLQHYHLVANEIREGAMRA